MEFSLYLALEARCSSGDNASCLCSKKHYESGSFEFVGVYGRRRVGKTALLGRFTHGLRAGWCPCVEDDAALNLRILSQAVFTILHPDSDPDTAPTYPDFRTAFEAAFAAARTERAVLVVDEFPYLAKTVPGISSILQASIDAHHEESRLFLVLCGSSLSFMREQLLDRNSPLYGRRTAQIELKPFDFFQSREFFPGVDAVTAANIFGMVGGHPPVSQAVRWGKGTCGKHRRDVSQRKFDPVRRTGKLAQVRGQQGLDVQRGRLRHSQRIVAA